MRSTARRLSAFTVSLAASPPWTVFVLAAAALAALLAVPPGRTARILAALNSLVPAGPLLAGNAAQSAGSLILAVVVIAACHCLGTAFLGWLGVRRAGTTRLLASAPTGFLLASTALLGAGLAGLWFTPLLVTGLLLSSIAGRGAPGRGAGGFAAGGVLRRFLRSTWSASPVAGRTGWILLAAWWLPALALPDLTVDAFSYHLALPAQVLRAHRLAAAGTFAPWMMPVPADLPNALPLALGLEPAGRATGLVIAILGAACFLRAALPGALSAPLLSLAILLGLMAPEASGVLGTAKSDGVTCGWALSGAGLLLGSGFIRGLRRTSGARLFAGTLLLGAAAAGKWVLFPFPAALLLAAVAMSARGTRSAVAWTGSCGLALTGLPWLARSWLAFGDPLPPVGSAAFPALFPGPGGEGGAVRFAVAWRLAAEAPGILPGAGGSIPVLVRNTFLPLSALALFAAARDRGPARMTLAALAGAAAMVAGAGGLRAHADRYAFPAFALMALAAAAMLLARERRQRFMVPALTVLAVLFHLRAAMPPPWGDPGREARAAAFHAGRLTEGQYREAGLGSYGRLLPKLREAMARDRGGPRRVIATCALLVHGVPAPVVPDGDYAPPFAWRAASASPTAARLAVKVRQSGAGWILYDPDLAYWKKLEPSPWAWTGRMLELWGGLFRSHATVAAAVPCHGPGAGAATLFRLHRSPAAGGRLSPYLPGSESAFHVPAMLGARGRYREAEQALWPLVSALPGFGDPRALMGHVLAAQGRYAEALPFLRSAEAAGVAGCAAPATLNRAVAAGRLGLRGEAGEALRRAEAVLTGWPGRVEQARKDAGL